MGYPRIKQVQKRRPPLKNKQNLALAIATVTIGVLAGLGAVLLSGFLELVLHFIFNFAETAQHPYVIVSPLHRLAAIVGGGIIAAVVWWVIRNRMKPTVSVKDAVAGAEMPGLTTVLHTFTQMLYVGVGGSVGRELAPREFAAMLAQWWQRVLHKHLHLDLSAEDQHLLVAAAAGAGFAGVYIAPITGMLFSVEILYKQVTRRAVLVSLSMSMIAMGVGSLLKGFTPYYLVGPQAFAPKIVALALLIGPLCGIVGAYFRRAIQWAGLRQAQRRPLLWQLPLAALITGLVAIKFPQVTGNGRALAQMVFNTDSRQVLGWLVLGALVKALVTIMSLKAGAAGGTLTPSIAVGSALGALLSVLMPGMPLWQAAMIGAASLLAVTQQAPLMAMFMLIEVSHLTYSAFLPLGVGIALAMCVANFFLPKRPAREAGETETAERLQAKVQRQLKQDQQ